MSGLHDLNLECSIYWRGTKMSMVSFFYRNYVTMLQVIGSLFSFYIPMTIMVVTYILTVHHLKKQKLTSLSGKRHVGGISSLVAATVGATAYPGVGFSNLPEIANTTTQQR